MKKLRKVIYWIGLTSLFIGSGICQVSSYRLNIVGLFLMIISCVALAAITIIDQTTKNDCS